MIYRKIDISDRDESISEDVAKEFVDHRINIKKPLTQGAFKRAMKTALGSLVNLGMPADWAITQTIDNGWQGINLEWLIPHVPAQSPVRQRYQSNVHSISSTRNQTLQQEIEDRSWAQ